MKGELAFKLYAHKKTTPYLRHTVYGEKIHESRRPAIRSVGGEIYEVKGLEISVSGCPGFYSKKRNLSARASVRGEPVQVKYVSFQAR